MQTLTRRRAGGFFCGLAAAIALPAGAQGDRPVSLVVPSSPGGSTDALGRAVAEAWPALTGRAMVVDNRPGANGAIGAAHVARAPADGSVLLLNTSTQAINPVAMRKLPFDPLRDFLGAGGLAQSPLLLVAHQAFEARDGRELKALAARQPQRLAFAVGDMATRLCTEQLLAALGARAATVPYKGTGPATTDVGGGHVPLTVTTIGAAMPLLRSGQLRPIGITARQRLKLLPDVPTLAEQGLDAVFPGWWGLSAPAAMPRPQLARLGEDVLRLVRSTAFESRIAAMYLTPMPLGPAEFDAFFAQDVRKMAELAQAAGIQPE